jgi:hypothetical protein
MAALIEKRIISHLGENGENQRLASAKSIRLRMAAWRQPA